MSSTALKTSAPLSYSDLDEQQQSAITRLYEENTLLIAQAGFGKTVVAQSAIQELIADDVVNRVIIFAPQKVCTLTWRTEWQKWEHLREPAIAIGTPKQRMAAVEDLNNEIVVMNFENMAWFFTTYGKDHGFDGLLVDEGSKMKTPSGTAMKKMRHRIGDFAWRCVMSATPVHESGTDIYTQMMLVDGGAALGTRQEKFRRNYFMQMDFKGYKWAFQPGGLERLAAAIAPSVFVADTEAYEAGLPHMEEVRVAVSLPEPVWDTYDAMCGKLVAEVKGVKFEALNLAVSIGKLQQICCGALYAPKTREVTWLHQAKFSALDLLLDTMPGSVVIAYQFIYERDYLVAHFGDEAMVLGDNPEKAVELWNAGKLKYLLVHPKSAGHGLNIQQGGCRIVCLSPLWSADAWDQLRRRLWRRGQPSDTVWRYTLCVTGSVEEDMLDRQIMKNEDSTRFIDHIRARANAQ